MSENTTEDELHPYRTCSNSYSMPPYLLRKLGIDVDERCVVCGYNQTYNDYYGDYGLIHCIGCALKHEHITEEEAKEHGYIMENEI